MRTLLAALAYALAGCHWLASLGDGAPTASSPSPSSNQPLSDGAAAGSAATLPATRGALVDSDDVALASSLCRDRPGCRLRQRTALPEWGAAVVQLAVRNDGEGCEGGEYWIIRRGPPASELRLAQDCDLQTEADQLAHVDSRLNGSQLSLSYRELKSSDQCEGVQATIDLSRFQLVRELRFAGAGGPMSCRHDDEVVTDWITSDHVARWGQASCDARLTPTPSRGHGAAIPKFVGTGGAAPTAVGSCGVLIDAARADRWMGAGARDTRARLRAMVVDDRLLIDVEGKTTGTITLIVANHAVSDGDRGGLGCAADVERDLSSTTVDLATGRRTSRGRVPAALAVTSREGGVVHLATEPIGSVGRIALSYESSDKQRLDSARLHSTPRVADLPALGGPFNAAEKCTKGARLDVRADNLNADPAISLR